MNLPELYAKVVEKHPGLAVPGMLCDPTESISAALIADHWTEMLPDLHSVTKDGAFWIVEWMDLEYTDVVHSESKGTRLEALAAFWLAYEGEVK